MQGLTSKDTPHYFPIQITLAKLYSNSERDPYYRTREDTEILQAFTAASQAGVIPLRPGNAA
jgi:hypothetical protein